MPIMPSVLIRFKRAGTTFDVRKSATTLITDGPYKYSRNPTYISLTLLYLGLGVFLNNMWVLMLVVPLLLIINFWIIRNEEHYLAEKFGEEYQSYRSKVRRWL
jgi:protein-S-isoprenylcysteine O-methyltransferase Ste14